MDSPVEIQGVIGMGAFGTVYRGMWQVSGEVLK